MLFSRFSQNHWKLACLQVLLKGGWAAIVHPGPPLIACGRGVEKGGCAYPPLTHIQSMHAGFSFSYSSISLLLRQPLSIKKSYAGAIQKGSFNPWPSHICWSSLHPPPSAKHVSCLGHSVQLPTVWKSVFSKIGRLFAESYLCNETSDRQNKIFLRNAIPFSFFHILRLFEFKSRFQAEFAM